MTADELTDILPEAARQAFRFAEPLTAAMAEFDINTPARQAAFIAQIGHESGQLRWLREIWGPTPVQERYEGRADLGNTQPGDGSKYRGRGLIQLTGRANYRTAGQALGLSLEDLPEMVERPEVACRTAAWFWKSRGLNELADAGEFEKITRRINGGLNGQADRLALYGRAQEVLA